MRQEQKKQKCYNCKHAGKQFKVGDFAMLFGYKVEVVEVNSSDSEHPYKVKHVNVRPLLVRGEDLTSLWVKLEDLIPIS